jgi:periplasmic copper chaperone A
MTISLRTRLLAAAAVSALLLPAACGDDDTDGAGTGDGTGDGTGAAVVVSGAWARTSPMMASNGAVYMELTSTVDDRLVGASVDEAVAADAEVHETVADDETGEMSMQEVEGIDLPQDETVSLEPGGYHVMLLDLAEPLEPGSTIEVVLELDESGEVPVRAEVRDDAGDMDAGDMDAGDMDAGDMDAGDMDAGGMEDGGMEDGDG